MAIKHEELIDMVVTARPMASDALALETVDMFPFWIDYINIPITQEMVDKGYDRYQYDGKLYKVVQPHTPQEGWEPDITPALWTEVSLEEWPEWRQPAGAQDAYKIGDKVSYNGKRYISKIDGNTTEPGTDERWWIEA